MSLLFDQNLSRRLPTLLGAEFPGSEQVLLAGMAGADGRAVWAYAAARGLAVVSKDADFQLLSAALGPPPKMVWLRVGNGPTREIEALLRLRAAEIQAFLSDPNAALLELPSWSTAGMAVGATRPRSPLSALRRAGRSNSASEDHDPRDQAGHQWKMAYNPRGMNSVKSGERAEGLPTECVPWPGV